MPMPGEDMQHLDWQRFRTTKSESHFDLIRVDIELLFQLL